MNEQRWTKLRPGDTFAHSHRGAPESDGVVAAIATASATLPFAAGAAGATRAYGAVVHAGACVNGIVAVFGDAQNFLSGDVPYHAWTIRADARTDQTDLALSLVDAIEPTHVVLHVRETTRHGDATCTIVDRLISATRAGVFVLLLESVGIDPSAVGARGVSARRAQFEEIAATYRSRFEGETYPREFVQSASRFLPDGQTKVPFEIRARYDGAKFVTAFPSLSSHARDLVRDAARRRADEMMKQPEFAAQRAQFEAMIDAARKKKEPR